MPQTYTFAMTQMHKDASGRKAQALEIREADTDRPVAIISYQESAEILLKAIDRKSIDLYPPLAIELGWRRAIKSAIEAVREMPKLALSQAEHPANAVDQCAVIADLERLAETPDTH